MIEPKKTVEEEVDYGPMLSRALKHREAKKNLAAVQGRYIPFFHERRPSYPHMENDSVARYDFVHSCEPRASVVRSFRY